ncbi:protein of unknown function [Tepidibacter aestuarii]|nr:protein of unknown function [Tepidibacter aestuarii]
MRKYAQIVRISLHTSFYVIKSRNKGTSKEVPFEISLYQYYSLTNPIKLI